MWGKVRIQVRIGEDTDKNTEYFTDHYDVTGVRSRLATTEILYISKTLCNDKTLNLYLLHLGNRFTLNLNHS